MTALRVLWWATRSGFADHGVIFTLRSWLLGWCVRVLAQVLFFVVIGQLLGGQEARYLLIGNSVMLLAVHGLLATSSTTWERHNGTLALLVASPSSPALVLIGRSLFWIPEGLLCAVGALVLLGPATGISLPAGGLLACLPLLALIGLSSYALGAFLGALMLVVPDLRNVVSNVAHLAMMILCGVNIPVGTLGPLSDAVAKVLPLTHGLRAVRDILSGTWSAASVGRLVALESIVAAAWMCLAVAAVHWLARRSRRDGHILFSQ